MLSVMPADMVAQAVSVAVRTASSLVVPEAVAQFERPWNSMHTSHVNWRSSIEEYTSTASSAAMTAKRMAANTGFIACNCNYATDCSTQSEACLLAEARRALRL